MTDIVLYNPKYSEIVQAGGVYYACPPLDLCYIAAVLEQDGFTVKIYDENVEQQPFKEYLKQDSPKILGVTASSMALPRVYAILGEMDAGIQVILTGQHVANEHEILASLGLKYGFIGYCERGFSQLCKILINGKGDLSRVDGLIQNVNGKIKVNGKNPSNFQSLPYPARHLLDLKKYKYSSISASRGCPYSCLYCASTGPFYCHDAKYVLRSPESVFQEMKDAFSRHKIDLFDFADDVFTYDKNFVKEFCRLLKESNLPVKWTCSTRPDLLSEEIAMELKNAGCIQVCIGVESGSQEIRKKISRDIPDKDIKKAFYFCRKAHLRTRASAIIGLPGETKKDIEDTIAFLKELLPTYIFIYPAILLPGSKMHNLALQEGLIAKDAWEKFMKGEALLPIYLPKGISRKDITNYLLEGHKKFYLSLGYLAQRVMEDRISGLKEYLGFISNYLG